jgi:antitoxin (DNA-binding transcriptional repressor) of toxin-antitoxin stability system
LLLVDHTCSMTMTPSEFKAECLVLIDHVREQGGELVLSRDGCPVARLVVPWESRPWLNLRGKGRFIGDAFQPTLSEKEIEALT